MADKPADQPPAGEPTDRQTAGERAQRRAAEAGARAAELRERLTSLRERNETRTPESSTDPLGQARKAASHALQRRDEAAQHDRAAHESAARAHDSAATAFERLAATTTPDQRGEYIQRAKAHREAAKADRQQSQASTSNEIRFDLQWRADLGCHEIVPNIDGVPLTELIDRFETATDMNPRGDHYGGLIPTFYRFGPMTDHYLGRTTDASGTRTPVLGCECGELGCWPLLTRISATEDLVVWDSFEQPHRKTRDYSAFGPFTFNRHHYDAALRALTTALASVDK